MACLRFHTYLDIRNYLAFIGMEPNEIMLKHNILWFKITYDDFKGPQCVGLIILQTISIKIKFIVRA